MFHKNQKKDVTVVMTVKINKNLIQAENISEI